MKNRGSTNNFSDWTKQILSEIGCCQKCGCNQGCSIHHIFSRISFSRYNAIVLCDKCHREADKYNRITGIKGTEFRRELLKITLKFWLSNEWWRDSISQKDRLEDNRFLEIIHSDLIAIKDI